MKNIFVFVLALSGLQCVQAAGSKYSYVSFLSSDEKLNVAGKLTLPEVLPAPAVVIVHGSAGPDSRGPFYAEELNRQGIATLEIDLWAARKLKGGLDRPKHVSETLPDAYGAAQYLASRSDIVGDKIGVMGFSWGGVVSMLTATREYAPELPIKPFSVHVAMYPVCWVYNKVPGYGFHNLSGAPVLIQAGKLDGYDAPDSCLKLHDALPAESKALVTLDYQDNATHGFDGSDSIEFFDPYAFLGKGGTIFMTPNKIAAERSRENTVAFIKKQLLQSQTLTSTSVSK